MNSKQHSTNRKFVIASAVTGVVLFGAAGFAAAAKGDSHPARVPTTVSVDDSTGSPVTSNTITGSSIDDKGGLAGGHGADDATSTSLVTVSSIDDHGTDATENSIDDNGADDATENSIDDNGDDATSTSTDDSTVTSVEDHGHDATSTSVAAPASTVTTVDDHGHGGHGSDD